MLLDLEDLLVTQGVQDLPDPKVEVDVPELLETLENVVPLVLLDPLVVRELQVDQEDLVQREGLESVVAQDLRADQAGLELLVALGHEEIVETLDHRVHQAELVNMYYNTGKE